MRITRLLYSHTYTPLELFYTLIFIRQKYPISIRKKEQFFFNYLLFAGGFLKISALEKFGYDMD